MGREDYLAQRILNLEHDKNNLISLLVEHLLCPKECKADGYKKFCTDSSIRLCEKTMEDCWAELVENRRPPEIYNTF